MTDYIGAGEGVQGRDLFGGYGSFCLIFMIVAMKMLAAAPPEKTLLH